MKYKSLKKAGLFAISFVTTLSLTACSFSFKKDVSESIQKSLSDTIGEALTDTLIDEAVSRVSEAVDNTDFADKEQLKELMSTITDELASETEITAAVGKFESASLVRVVDGDTIVIEIEGDEYKVRMIGIDTPESVASQEYLDRTGKENSEEGMLASDYTKDLLSESDIVYLQKDTSDTDRYGRLLRYVWLEIPDNEMDMTEISTKMVNAILLERGVAEVATYNPDTMYEEVFEEIAESRE